MLPRNKTITKEILTLTWVITLMIVSGVVATSIAGFVLGGFEPTFFGKPLGIGDDLLGVIVFYGFIFIGIISLMVFGIREIVIYKGESPLLSNKNRVFSTVISHDPEEDGFMFLMFKPFFPKFTKWLSNPFRIFLLSFIVFGIIGIFSTTTGTFFADIPQTQFQVTETSQVIFAGEPASTGENSLFIFTLLSLQLGFILFLTKLITPRVNDEQTRFIRLLVFFMLAVIIIVPLFGYEWMQYHSIRYGNDDVKLFATFI